jgi:hypothetical protein
VTQKKFAKADPQKRIFYIMGMEDKIFGWNMAKSLLRIALLIIANPYTAIMAVGFVFLLNIMWNNL